MQKKNRKGSLRLERFAKSIRGGGLIRRNRSEKETIREI